MIPPRPVISRELAKRVRAENRRLEDPLIAKYREASEKGTKYSYGGSTMWTPEQREKRVDLSEELRKLDRRIAWREDLLMRTPRWRLEPVTADVEIQGIDAEIREVGAQIAAQNKRIRERRNQRIVHCVDALVKYVTPPLVVLCLFFALGTVGNHYWQRQSQENQTEPVRNDTLTWAETPSGAFTTLSYRKTYGRDALASQDLNKSHSQIVNAINTKERENDKRD